MFKKGLKNFKGCGGSYSEQLQVGALKNARLKKVKQNYQMS
jgi:hypothetical protein